MKKRIQKYLAGEREGFSLVELIIVIAIMAILIGVIALAVIPNIQRSRESKDLSVLDNIMSAANTAVANARLEDSLDDFVIYDNSGAFQTSSNTSFDNSFKEAIGDGSVSLGSGVTDGCSIYLAVDVSSGNAKIKVYAATEEGEDNAVECKYTNDDTKTDGTKAKMLVKS